MLANSLNISDTTKRELFELIFFQSDQKISKRYCRADPFRTLFGPFNMLTVRKFSHTGLFSHYSNYTFCSL